MREFHPNPLVQINPITAEELGIKEGDWVWIESPHGHCKQKATLFVGIKPGVVHAEHGWWFPEQEAAEPSLFGTFDSNINNMTKNFETGLSGMGTGIKSFLVRVYKVEEGDELPGVTVTRKGGFGDYIRGVYAGDMKTALERLAGEDKGLADLEAAKAAIDAKVADADMQGRKAALHAKEVGEAEAKTKAGE
jgi:hypothetical protein